jgi:hypothetical protein
MTRAHDFVARHPVHAWLLAWRPSVLAALSRLESETAMLAAAEELGRRKPRPSEALAIIRRHRRGEAVAATSDVARALPLFDVEAHQ